MDDYLSVKKRELISKLESYRYPIVGIGVTAFNRIAPAFFLSNFQLICYKNSTDVDLMKASAFKVKSIQADFQPEDIPRLNTLSILKHKKVVKFLTGLQKGKIFVYRTSKKIDSLAEKYGLTVVANKAKLRDRYEHKIKFRQIGKRVGIPLIPGETLSLAELDENKWLKLKKKYSSELVFQLTEYSLGGGKGTFFISDKGDFFNFWRAVKTEQKKKLKFVNVTKRIFGPSPSITGCVTRWGVLSGVVQTQILDQPELKIKNLGGVFCGHDWSFCHYPKDIQKQAEKICRRFGEYMYDHGYRGIYGLDLIIDKKSSQVYPVECNPRYTGAFPVYSMMQMELGEIPLDTFQLLEFLEIDYEVDIDKVNQSWKTPKEGAHAVLYNPYPYHWSKVTGSLPAGVYKLTKDKLEFVRSGFSYLDINNSEEFVYTDGSPRQGDLLKPGLRCGKLIFKRRIMTADGNLLPEIKKLVAKVYAGLGIVKILQEPKWSPKKQNWIFPSLKK